MKLFAGLDRTDYQDILRALGRMCDERGWRNVRMIEYDDGLIVQYTEGPGSQRFRMTIFSDDELRDLLSDAYARRSPTAVEEEAEEEQALTPEA